MGLLEPSRNQLTQFIEKISALGGAGADIATMLEAGNSAVEAQDFAGAMKTFQQAMDAEPESVEALAGVVRCMIRYERPSSGTRNC